MIDLLNRKVKIYLQGGLTAEGVVVEQTQNYCILSNAHNKNLFVINDPDKNIQATIIFDSAQNFDIDLPNPELKDPFKLPPVSLEKIPKPQKYSDLNLLELGELKKIQRDQYLTRLKREMNTPHIDPNGNVEYSLPPNFFKKS